MSVKSIYIVEDEPIIVSTIETALRKQGYHVIGDSENVRTALKDITAFYPDLVLIDIQLEGTKDGIDLAIELDKHKQPYVFLTSQTDPKTIDRVKQTNPLGYIVKPFTENSLRSNIEVAWHQYQLLDKHFITIKSEGKLYKIDQDSILYLKAFDNYCYIYTTTRSHLVPHTLKYMSEKLNHNKFTQTHRSYWVNLDHIDAIENSTILLKTEPIPLSNSQKQKVIQKLKKG